MIKPCLDYGKLYDNTVTALNELEDRRRRALGTGTQSFTEQSLISVNSLTEQPLTSVDSFKLCTCAKCNPRIDCEGIARRVSNSVEYDSAVLEERGKLKGEEVEIPTPSHFTDLLVNRMSAESFKFFRVFNIDIPEPATRCRATIDVLADRVRFGFEWDPDSYLPAVYSISILKRDSNSSLSSFRNDLSSAVADLNRLYNIDAVALSKEIIKSGKGK